MGGGADGYLGKRTPRALARHRSEHRRQCRWMRPQLASDSLVRTECLVAVRIVVRSSKLDLRPTTAPHHAPRELVRKGKSLEIVADLGLHEVVAARKDCHDLLAADFEGHRVGLAARRQLSAPNL